MLTTYSNTYCTQHQHSFAGLAGNLPHSIEESLRTGGGSTTSSSSSSRSRIWVSPPSLSVCLGLSSSRSAVAFCFDLLFSLEPATNPLYWQDSARRSCSVSVSSMRLRRLLKLRSSESDPDSFLPTWGCVTEQSSFCESESSCSSSGASSLSRAAGPSSSLLWASSFCSRISSCAILRFMLEFQWFLMALSVRPASSRVSLAHLPPISRCAMNSLHSYSAVHSPRLMLGSRWLNQRSRHCFPSRWGTLRAITDQRCGPKRETASRRRASSSGVQAFLGQRRCWRRVGWGDVRFSMGNDYRISNGWHISGVKMAKKSGKGQSNVGDHLASMQSSFSIMSLFLTVWRSEDGGTVQRPSPVSIRGYQTCYYSTSTRFLRRPNRGISLREQTQANTRSTTTLRRRMVICWLKVRVCRG